MNLSAKFMRAVCLIGLVGLEATSGCVPAPRRSVFPAHASSPDSARIQYFDPDLHDHTVIGPVRLTRDESGLLHVDVSIRATANLAIYVEYRGAFLDANGIPLSQSGSWTTITVPTATWQHIQISSASPRAVDYHMDLRYAR